MKLTSNQEYRVTQLFSNYKKNLNQIFVAPTGAGKTFMMFNLMLKIKEHHEFGNDKYKSNKIFFIFESLSKAKLANQICESIKQYDKKGELNIVHIPSPSNETYKKQSYKRVL